MLHYGTMDHLRRLCGGVLVGIVLAACAPAAERPHRSEAAVTVLYPGDERILGPYWEMPAKFLMFLPLVRLDEQGEIEGVLARRWEHSADYRTWTIHLRTDVTWHDGVLVTAHDVKFTFDLFAHPDVLWESRAARTAEVVDDSTFTVTYHRGGNSPLSTWRVFYPRHLLDTLAPAELNQWAFWTRPVGNGPYRYVRHVPKTMLELEANPAYFRGKPAVERLVLKFHAQGTSKLPELLSGNVDALGWASRMDLVKLAGDDRYEITYEVGTATRGIMWKADMPLFADSRVRRAMTLAIDRRELHALLGYPSDVPLPDGPLTDRQFRRGAFPPPLPQDPDEARRLLDEAGWRDRDGDGMREREGRPFRFTLLVPAEERDAGVYVQDQLGRVGVRVEISTVQLNIVRQRSRAGDFEAVLVWLDRGRDARFFGSGGSAGYRNARVDTLLGRIQDAFNPEARDSLYGELYAIFRREQPATVLFPGVAQFVVPHWLEGLSNPWRADPLVNMEHLWIEER